MEPKLLADIATTIYKSKERNVQAAEDDPISEELGVTAWAAGAAHSAGVKAFVSAWNGAGISFRDLMEVLEARISAELAALGRPLEIDDEPPLSFEVMGFVYDILANQRQGAILAQADLTYIWNPEDEEVR